MFTTWSKYNISISPFPHTFLQKNVVKVVLSLNEGTELKCDTGNLIRSKKPDYVSMIKGILHLSFLWSAAQSQPCYKLPQQSKQAVMIPFGNTMDQRKLGSTQNTNRSK